MLLLLLLRPFDHIDQSVSLLCPTGYFTLSLSLYVSFRSCLCSSSSSSSFNHIYNQIFFSLSLSFFLSLFVSFRSCLCSSCSSSFNRIYNRIFSSLFTCLCDLVRVRVLLGSIVSIHPSLIVSYRIFSSLFTCHSDLVRSSSSFSFSFDPIY